MLVREVVKNNEPSLSKPSIMLPLDQYRQLAPLLQKQRDANQPKPQPLTRDQLDRRLAAARQEKMRKLAIALQNRKIWAQSELVTPKDKADAARIGEPEIPEIDTDNWLELDGDINWKAFGPKK
jgi:hypothetical protein